MPFQKFNTANNAICLLSLPVSDTDLTLIATGNYGRFPTANFIIKVTQYDTDGVTVLARENMLVTSRTGASFFIGTRAYEAVPISDAASTNIQQALPFTANSVIECVVSLGFLDDVQDEVARLETDKLNKAGDTLTGLLQGAKSTNIASATTTDLSTATGNEVHITGTSTITSFGTVTAGTQINLIFDGILTLTHNATSLILPNSGSNITTAVGDSAVVVSEGAGDWKCISYQRANGSPLAGTPTTSAEKTFVAGEAITQGNAVRLGDSVNNLAGETQAYTGGSASSTNSEAIGYSTTFRKGGQSITLSAGGLLSSIDLHLKRSGTPVGNLTCKLYTDTGTTLFATATNTVSEGGLTTSYVATNFAFSGQYIPAGVYYIELSTDRADSTSNYSFWAANETGASYTGGVMYTISSTPTWSTTAFDRWFSVNISAYTEDTTKVYTTSASIAAKSNFIGFSKETVSASANVRIDIAGTSEYQSGLTSASEYYLSNTSGAISTTPGTITIPVGKALSTTSIEIKNDGKLSEDRYRNVTDVVVLTRDTSAASSAVAYSHQLGKIPKAIIFSSIRATNAFSNGAYDGSENKCAYPTGTPAGATSSTRSIFDYQSVGVSCDGYVSASTANDFTITWTKTGAASGTCYVVATLIS